MISWKERLVILTVTTFAVTLACELPTLVSSPPAEDVPGPTTPQPGTPLDVTAESAPPQDTPMVPSVATLPSGTLVIAYVKEGNLFTWTEGGDPLMVASDATSPIISPGGVWVAFRRGDDLHVVSIDGSEEHLIVSASSDLPSEPELRTPYTCVWLNDSAMLFNTKLLIEYGFALADDLWTVSIPHGDVSRVLPDDSGGWLVLSPDGTQVTLSTPGLFGESNTSEIHVANVDGSNRRLLFAFAPVSTASEYAFYAVPQWSLDSASLVVAIPNPNLVYGPDQFEGPPVELYRLSVSDGTEPERLGEVNADFFGLPSWSPSLEHLAFVETIPPLQDNRIRLMLAGGDGSDPTSYTEGIRMDFEFGGWSPYQDVFTYSLDEPGITYLGGPGLAPRRIPSENERAFDIIFVDDSTFVYADAPPLSGSYELRVADLESGFLFAVDIVAGATSPFHAIRTP